MALFKPLLGSLSGSIAGNTFSHNRFGAYARHRAIPVNPKTSGQETVRASLGLAATRWKEILTQAQRDAWNTYALSVTRTNALGEPYNPSGWQLFAGLTAWAQRSGIGITGFATAPTDPGAAAQIITWASVPVVVDTAGATNPQTLTTDIAGLANWDDDVDDDRMMIQIGRQQSPGVFFYNGPWTFVASVVGNATTPPTDQTYPVAQSLDAGNVIWLRYSHVDPIRRMAPASIQRVVITTN